MAEALEHWPCDLFESLLPRLYSIVKEINRRLMEKITVFYPNDPGKWEYMQVISGGEVRMANLCLACCHMTNGVSRLHTDILMKDVFQRHRLQEMARTGQSPSHGLPQGTHRRRLHEGRQRT